eukprot:CAMPEP_0118713392 /NCGR_PEP_ID=MMETSP0800-20121206/25484_1 /TAXON_ID=210618 ORGANISM="Striatella unipunctata, Strain CCMP2910" /NCGR_SAMPLE_ID=MMETSP0800 /ASSEMBLY_ACC=CAM_ASM_000638 /LENGTH=481 /DNA_ID=CAMNT_0006618825 /DNA_START=76 /DNA_END=1521 /DNA_ORIENTATION=-
MSTTTTTAAAAAAAAASAVVVEELKLTSTTAPGKYFASRSDLATHYKSDWHKYNLKRREAALPMLKEEDFAARLEAALSLRREREEESKRSKMDHIKQQKKKQHIQKKKDGVTVTSQAPAWDKIKHNQQQQQEEKEEETQQEKETEKQDKQQEEDKEEEVEEPPEIDPCQSLFDSHVCKSVEENLERMQKNFGFFIPDAEYLVDKEGLVGYCAEKIKIGHVCLYCQKTFSTWRGCQEHMVATQHTKLRYEAGVDLEEFDPFYDFSAANAEYQIPENDDDDDDDDDEWEDVSDDEEIGEEADEQQLYHGYQDEIAKFGFDVTPLGELVFPNGKIIGHRGLARYYKQRIVPDYQQERTAVVAARRAAGERIHNGRVYELQQQQQLQQQRLTSTTKQQQTLALTKMGITPSVVSGRAAKGVLVATPDSGYAALSLYRYKAVVRKSRREEASSRRLQYRTRMNMNRMDKKGNRMMNGVSVAHAKR